MASLASRLLQAQFDFIWLRDTALAAVLHHPLCLSSKSPPGLGCLKVQLSPHTSYPYSEEFWCPNGIRSFLFLHGGIGGECWWQSCPLALFLVGDFPYTPFVHSNCKGAQYCFPFQTTPWVAFVLHGVIKERKLSPFPSCLCFSCVSHYRCRGHSLTMSKTGGNK